MFLGTIPSIFPFWITTALLITVEFVARHPNIEMMSIWRVLFIIYIKAIFVLPTVNRSTESAQVYPVMHFIRGK